MVGLVWVLFVEMVGLGFLWRDGIYGLLWY